MKKTSQKTLIEANQVYTADEVGLILSCTRYTVLLKIRAREIKAKKVGNTYRIIGSSIISYLKS